MDHTVIILDRLKAELAWVEGLLACLEKQLIISYPAAPLSCANAIVPLIAGLIFRALGASAPFMIVGLLRAASSH